MLLFSYHFLFGTELPHEPEARDPLSRIHRVESNIYHGHSCNGKYYCHAALQYDRYVLYRPARQQRPGRCRIDIRPGVYHDDGLRLYGRRRRMRADCQDAWRARLKKRTPVFQPLLLGQRMRGRPICRRRPPVPGAYFKFTGRKPGDLGLRQDLSVYSCRRRSRYDLYDFHGEYRPFGRRRKGEHDRQSDLHHNECGP